jgi:arylsulfatase A-like enzyme
MPTLLTMVGIDVDFDHKLDGVDVSKVFRGQMAMRPEPIGFWHHFEPGQSTWSDRILKVIMEKQAAGLPEPYDPPRMLKNVYDLPEYPEDTAKGHAAWLDWPWKLHRIDGSKYELYNLADDPIEQEDLSEDEGLSQRLDEMREELAEWQRSVIRSLDGHDYTGMVKE